MSSGGSLMGSSSGVSSCTTPTQMADGRTSFIPSPDVMEDLAPMSRDRCNTWPMRRPNMDLNAQTSPLAQEGIPEEEVDLYDSSDNLNRLGASSTVSSNLMHSPDGHPTFSPGMSSPVMNGVPHSGASDTSDGGQCPKKSTTRKNAWGNMSYADLITQAIMESPEKRLTLSQVYEWMVQNVSYFRDKGDSNSSAGWKVGPGILESFKDCKLF